ncbi:MAG: helix-turn-helix transcriptional regulator [Planctomycetota bacterium]
MNAVWYVDGDETYVINPISGSGLVAIRTLKGTGVIVYKDGRILEPGAESLVFVEFGNLKEYHCKEDLWQFWWFEFSVPTVFELPLDYLVSIPLVPNEVERLNQIFLMLQWQDPARSKFASAGFSYLLYEYSLTHYIEQQKSPYRDAVLKVINLMNNRLESPLSVDEMASQANMSVRNFRKVFREITGKSPRDFYSDIRMQRALSFLQGGYSINRAARLLGFSSPFYFSNAFLKHFGVRPSDAASIQKSADPSS